MEEIKELNIFTKTVLTLGLLFLMYGFLSRIIPIDFFWESKSIGWGLILLGLIGLLINGITKRKINNKKTIQNKIGIGFMCFFFLIQVILIIVMLNTEAYKVSKDFIINNEELRSEVGEIQGFGLFPTGGVSIQTDSNGETGSANLNLIIKGDRAYKSVTVIVFKDYGKDWKVYRIE